MKCKFLIIIIFFLSACNQNEVQNITIGKTLVENHSYSQNRLLIKNIEGVLAQESKFLPMLLEYDCGGAAGCYGLGNVIVQIINKIGEEKFIAMVKELNNAEKEELRGFINVGLEYGDSLHKNRKNRTFESEFPTLFKEININHR